MNLDTNNAEKQISTELASFFLFSNKIYLVISYLSITGNLGNKHNLPPATQDWLLPLAAYFLFPLAGFPVGKSGPAGQPGAASPAYQLLHTAPSWSSARQPAPASGRLDAQPHLLTFIGGRNW